jgi:initiation factor 1A
MVKNTKGGSGHKSQARKFATSGKVAAKTRLSMDESEIYAQVTAIMGGGMCNVTCSDGRTRLCIIRGKFRGRGKRDNFVNRGSWVLVGIREWASESSSDKIMEKCDLLEVYSDVDKEKLKTLPGKKSIFLQFVANDLATVGSSSSALCLEEEDFKFSTATDDDYNRLMNDDVEGTGTGLARTALHTIGDLEFELDGTNEVERLSYLGDVNIDDI